MTKRVKRSTSEETSIIAEDGAPNITAEETNRPEIASRPRSTITGRHDEGSGANETIDGLDELQESTRHGAEDVPDKRTTLKDIPVFDRAESEPKV